MKRLITGVLAAAMLLTPLEPAFAYAGTVSAEELSLSQNGIEEERVDEGTQSDEHIGKQSKDRKAISTPTPVPAVEPEATPVADSKQGEKTTAKQSTEPSPVVTPSPSPTPEPVDWSSEKDSFLITVEQLSAPDSGEGSLAVQFSFPQMDAKDGVRAGDEAVFALPVDLMEVEDSEEPVDVFAFVPKEEEEAEENAADGEGTQELSVTQAQAPEEAEEPEETALDVAIAQYEISDGVVHIVFTDGVEEKEVREQIQDVYGKIDITFQWKENIRGEEPQTYDWVLQTYDDETDNKVTIEIPALAAEPTPEEIQEPEEATAEEAAPTPAPTEEATDVEKPMLMMALLDDSTVSIGGTIKYETSSQERDIY